MATDRRLDLMYGRLWHKLPVRGVAPIFPLSGAKPTVGGRGREDRS